MYNIYLLFIINYKNGNHINRLFASISDSTIRYDYYVYKTIVFDILYLCLVMTLLCAHIICK